MLQRWQNERHLTAFISHFWIVYPFNVFTMKQPLFLKKQKKSFMNSWIQAKKRLFAVALLHMWGEMNVDADLWGPARLSLRCSQYCRIAHGCFHICASFEYIIEAHWNPVKKKKPHTPSCSPFPVTRCVSVAFEMLKRSSPCATSSMMLSVSPVCLVSVSVSAHFSSSTSYSLRNGPSYL